MKFWFSQNIDVRNFGVFSHFRPDRRMNSTNAPFCFLVCFCDSRFFAFRRCILTDLLSFPIFTKGFFHAFCVFVFCRFLFTFRTFRTFYFLPTLKLRQLNSQNPAPAGTGISGCAGFGSDLITSHEAVTVHAIQVGLG